MNGFELILPFLRPIEHLILDPGISEIMVNGPDQIFVEKHGYIQAVPNVRLTPESLMVAVKNIARRLGDDIFRGKTASRFQASRRQPCGGGDSTLQHPGHHANDSEVQFPQIQDGKPD